MPKEFLRRCLGLLVAISLCLPAFEVIAGDEIFVAVGYGGRRASSRDGVKWENDQRWSDQERDDDNALFNVTYGLGRFIAVGGGAKLGHLLSTRDGREWVELPNVKGRVTTIAFGEGRFVAGHGNRLLWSDDGEKFQAGARLPIKGSVHPRRSASGDTEAGYTFVIIGDVDLAGDQPRRHWRGTTTNGERWTSHAVETSEARDIAYGSGHFVVVGPRGLIETSHDGQTWRRHQTRVTDDFSRVVWTGKRFLVSGGKKAWSSPDGLTWAPTPAEIPCSLAWAREGMSTQGIGVSWGGKVWISPDLVAWTKAPIAPGPSFNAVASGAP